MIDAQWIDELYEWNKEAFGPGKRTQGVLDHIRKELLEIEAKPDDLEEWIDVLLLAINGAQRLNVGGAAILEMLDHKVKKNKARSWPDWRTADPDKAIQHNKTSSKLDIEARELYEEMTGNDPYIHCNRFPLWNELSDFSKDQWRNKVRLNEFKRSIGQ